jgi:hypothetical protein
MSHICRDKYLCFKCAAETMLGNLRRVNGMDWKLFLSIGVPALVVVTGWFLAHWLTARRDLASKKREQRLKALEACYMRIATSSNRDFTAESMEKLEIFVSEIQLYGTPHQISLMGTMVNSFKAGEKVSYDALLADLRDTIRGQLALERVEGPVWWLRFARNPAPATASEPPAQPHNESSINGKSEDPSA